MSGTALADPPSATAEAPAQAAPAPPGGDREGVRWRRPRRRGPCKPAGSAVRAAWTTRVAQLGLWALVTVGAAAGTVALVLQLAGAAEPAADVPAPGSSTAAEGFAELYVAAFLAAGEGAEDALEPFYPEPVSLSGVEPGTVWVQRTAAVDVAAQGEGAWAVTVAAEVLLADDGGWRPGGRRFYQVGVAETGSGLAATSLPARIAAPRMPGRLPERAVGAFSGAKVDAEPVRTAERFLAAYLAGEGEVERYAAPRLGLAPLEPAGYTGVEVRRAGSQPHGDGRVLLGVEATAVEAGGRVEVLHYWLDLAERDGRWEVIALHPAAPLPRSAAAP